MDDPQGENELKELEKIREELQDISRNTSNRGWFWRGILYGAGAVVGSLVAVLLVGWVLSLLGVIPGFGVIAQDLGSAFTHVR